MIALAVALKEFGLTVSFYSEKDPNPNLIEKRCFLIAERTGINIKSAIALNLLLKKKVQLKFLLYYSIRLKTLVILALCLASKDKI